MRRTMNSEAWGRAIYLDRDAGLPDMGASPLGPRALTRGDTDAILACSDVAAVAELRAYAHSYFAVGGSVIGGIAATLVLGLAGKRGLAAASAVSTVLTGTIVMEARRRARQWEAVADARLATGGTAA